jgi:hypothetical protein
MSGFAKYTHKDNFRLKERPSYRKGQGADPIKSFVARSYATYSQNADRIRDARFAKSNELNRDYAIRNKREQMLSKAYMTETDPVKLAGLHGRLRAKMSRSDGALSSAMPYVYKTKFNDPRRNKRSASGGGSAGAQSSVAVMSPQARTQPVSPSPTKNEFAHSSPSVASKTEGAGFSIARKTGNKSTREGFDKKLAGQNQMYKTAPQMTTRQKTYTEMIPTPETWAMQQRRNAMSPQKTPTRHWKTVTNKGK